jgi:hypothetical protein
MSTMYLLNVNPSSNSSQYGVNKLSFGQKSKKKVTNTNVKDISENDYENLCLEVTRRILDNRHEEQELYGKLYCNTTKNNNTTLNSQFSFGMTNPDKSHNVRVSTQPDSSSPPRGILKSK